MAQATTLLAETLGATWWRWAKRGTSPPSDYEFVLLGFAATDNARRRRWRPSWTPMTLGPGPYPLRLGDGNARGFPPRRSLPAPARGPCWEPALLFTPETEEAAITQWAQSCPCAMGALPRKGYGKHRGHRPGDPPRPAGPLPLGGGKRARRHRLHRKQRRIL